MFVSIAILDNEIQPIQYLLVQPGKQIILMIDNADISFRGNGGAANEVFLRCARYMNKINGEIQTLINSNKSSRKVIGKLLSYEEKFEKFYHSLTDSIQLDQSERSILLNNYLSHFLWKKQLYLSNLSSELIQKKNLETELDLMTNKLLKDSILLPANCIPIKNFLISHYDYIVSSNNLLIANDPPSYPKITHDCIMRSSFYGESQKEFLAYVNLVNCFNWFGLTPRNEALFEEFTSMYPNSDYQNHLSRLQEEYDQLATNKMAPDFALVSYNDDTTALIDLRGAIIFIDVWATWCSPCISGFPAIKELQNKFPEVKFIYVSIDSDENNWKAYIQNNLDVNDLHLFASASNFKNLYRIRGIPRYILIDENGVIINAFIVHDKVVIEDELKNVVSR